MGCGASVHADQSPGTGHVDTKQKTQQEPSKTSTSRKQQQPITPRGSTAAGTAHDTDEGEAGEAGGAQDTADGTAPAAQPENEWDQDIAAAIMEDTADLEAGRTGGGAGRRRVTATREPRAAAKAASPRLSIPAASPRSDVSVTPQRENLGLDSGGSTPRDSPRNTAASPASAATAARSPQSPAAAQSAYTAPAASTASPRPQQRNTATPEVAPMQREFSSPVPSPQIQSRSTPAPKPSRAAKGLAKDFDNERFRRANAGDAKPAAAAVDLFQASTYATDIYSATELIEEMHKRKPTVPSIAGGSGSSANNTPRSPTTTTRTTTSSSVAGATTRPAAGAVTSTLATTKHEEVFDSGDEDMMDAILDDTP